MIPASYLFKDYYERHWLDAEPEGRPNVPEPFRRFRDGLTRRVTDARPVRRTGLRRLA